MNRRKIARCLAAAACAALTAGCANLLGSSSSPEQIAARDLAFSIADPASGTTGEITDLGAFLFSAGAARLPGSAPWGALFRAGDFALYLTAAFEAGKLTWNPAADDYEITGTRSIAAGPISGSADVTIDVAFFTSADASGTGVQIPSGSESIPSTIHSLGYRRELSGTFSNSVSGAQRQVNESSTFTVTGLSSGSPGFTVNGTKTVTFMNTYADGRKVSGTLVETISDLAVSAVLQANGTWMVGATGTIAVGYSALIIRADGTTVQVQKTATVTLDGRRIVHVEMDGADVDVDVTTGLEG